MPHMARKLILDIDPGIDDAVALCLALEDPLLDVLAVTATGGTVSPEQSTMNVQAIVEQLDPPRWPRLGCASKDQMLRADGRHIFGANGLCGAHFAVVNRHHQHSSVKVICDEVRAAPGDVTIVATGPLTNIAAALQQQPDLASLIGHLIMIGGTLASPGNVTAVGRVQYLLRRRSGEDRFPFAGHQDADSDRSDEPNFAELRSAGKDSEWRFATRRVIAAASAGRVSCLSAAPGRRGNSPARCGGDRRGA